MTTTSATTDSANGQTSGDTLSSTLSPTMLEYYDHHHHHHSGWDYEHLANMPSIPYGDIHHTASTTTPHTTANTSGTSTSSVQTNNTNLIPTPIGCGDHQLIDLDQQLQSTMNLNNSNNGNNNMQLQPNTNDIYPSVSAIPSKVIKKQQTPAKRSRTKAIGKKKSQNNRGRHSRQSVLKVTIKQEPLSGDEQDTNQKRNEQVGNQCNNDLDGANGDLNTSTATSHLDSSTKSMESITSSAGGQPNSNNSSSSATVTGATNREMHNEIERRRRLRIKYCCDILRGLVPGVNDKTDKATVLEHTVRFVRHLKRCPNFSCNCELNIPPTKS